MRVKFAYAVSLAAAVALLTASGKKDGEAGNGAAATADASAGSASVVKIGHVAPFAGGIAHLGNDNENGARLALAVEHFNARGRTAGGRRIESAFDAREAAAESSGHDAHPVVRTAATIQGAAHLRAIPTNISGVQPGAIRAGGMDATGEPLTKQAARGSRAKIPGGGVCIAGVGALADTAAQRPVCPEAALALPATDRMAGPDMPVGDRNHTPAQIDAPYTHAVVGVIVDAVKRARSLGTPAVLAVMPFSGANRAIGAIAAGGNGGSKAGAIALHDFKDGKKAVLDVVEA